MKSAVYIKSVNARPAMPPWPGDMFLSSKARVYPDIGRRFTFSEEANCLGRVGKGFVYVSVYIIIGNKDAAKFIYINCASSSPGAAAIPLLASYKDSFVTDQVINTFNPFVVKVLVAPRNAIKQLSVIESFSHCSSGLQSKNIQKSVCEDGLLLINMDDYWFPGVGTIGRLLIGEL
jgi:hypothetical protein